LTANRHIRIEQWDLPLNRASEIEILAHPLAEQQAINAELDEKRPAIDKLTAKLHDELALLTEHHSRLISGGNGYCRCLRRACAGA
jgi:restriction endonuclease S subunit